MPELAKKTRSDEIMSVCLEHYLRTLDGGQILLSAGMKGSCQVTTVGQSLRPRWEARRMGRAFPHVRGE